MVSTSNLGSWDGQWTYCQIVQYWTEETIVGICLEQIPQLIILLAIKWGRCEMSMILGKPRPAYDREPSEKLGYRMTSPMISSASLACLIMRRSSANSMFGQTKKWLKHNSQTIHLSVCWWSIDPDPTHNLHSRLKLLINVLYLYPVEDVEAHDQNLLGDAWGWLTMYTIQ